MEGPSCRKMAELDVAEKAVKIVADEAKLVEDKAATDDEIDRYTNAMRRLLQLNGIMISLCYSKPGTLTDRDMVKARLVVRLFHKQFREISETAPPRVHMWSHLLEDLEELRGLMHHQEGFIELMHQEGKCMQRRFGGVRDGILKIEDSTRQASAQKQASQAKIDEVNLKAKRKLSEATKAKQEEAVARRKEKLQELEDAVLESETINSFADILELHIQGLDICAPP